MGAACRKRADVAKEMVRVTKPDGRIVMGNGIPNDPTLVAQILKISSAYTPPPPDGFVSAKKAAAAGLRGSFQLSSRSRNVPPRHCYSLIEDQPPITPISQRIDERLICTV